MSMEVEEEEEMPKANDRRRAKDWIIEGIAKAVKHVRLLLLILYFSLSIFCSFLVTGTRIKS